MIKFYFVSLRYSNMMVGGKEFVSHSCGVSRRHPFKVMESIRQEEREVVQYQMGLALGPLGPQGRAELLSWQEISEEEYHLGLSADAGVYDLDVRVVVDDNGNFTQVRATE